ncbi:hypothetical protein [uncultured Aquimarina sp.]|uniref:hypothetical protein n=1 Tax=uncultured Aquimarina sp. TaxID=575652 RepID=UPI0026292229|nr:hypothetical protein [uncultured Aquimarina sp.]
MNISQTDRLNTILILLSFGLAYFLPFELFLMAYAILGPLHYFTEVNWIRDNNYFVSNTNWIYIVLAFALLLSVPKLLKLEVFTPTNDNDTVVYIRSKLPTYLNSLFFIGIVIAIALIAFKNRQKQLIIIGLAIIVAVLMHQFTLYHVIFSIFIPTIIHVYLFTLFFMWYGNLKNKSHIGSLNVLLIIIIPVIICFIPVDQGLYNFSENIKSNYVGNNFHILNTNISKILGLTDGSKFFFYEILDLKIQMFISFAYTYHYLNWFSKTTIIRWHQKLTTKKSLIILILWMLSISLYFYDYKTGLELLLFCSLVHVFVEFPLNIISIREIGRHYLTMKKNI